MKDKLINLYINNIDEFITLTTAFYGHRIENVYTSYVNNVDESDEGKKSPIYLFQIEGTVMDRDYVINEMYDVMIKYQLFRQYDLVD